MVFSAQPVRGKYISPAIFDLEYIKEVVLKNHIVQNFVWQSFILKN